MSAPMIPERFESYCQFYGTTYPHAVTEVRPAGRSGAMMLLADQGAGDWSDTALPDLVISTTVRRHAPATMDVGGGRFHIRAAPPGDFVVVPPGFATTFLVDGPHAIRVLAVPYAKLLAFAGEDAGLPPDGDFGRLHCGPQRDRVLTTLIERLWAEGACGSPHGSLWAEGALLQVTADLLRLREGKPAPSKGGLAPWQVRRVIECLDAHIANDTSLAALAALVDLSPNHFCTAFRVSMGEPPHRYLVRRRIERAKELLADPRLSVTDVALAVGFGSSAHFATAFRKEVGVTPSGFRRERLP